MQRGEGAVWERGALEVRGGHMGVTGGEKTLWDGRGTLVEGGRVILYDGRLLCSAASTPLCVSTQLKLPVQANPSFSSSQQPGPSQLPGSPLMLVEAFLAALTSADKDGRIVVSQKR